MDIIFKIYEGVPRQGPGEDEYTEKAYNLIASKLPAQARIIDIGCGHGTQTLRLAELSRGQILATDIHQPFLDRLNELAKEKSLEQHIETRNISMDTLDSLPDESFDLVWSEGAIFVIGFEKGLKEWQRILKPGGFVVVSELTWFKGNPPDEAKQFWAKAYPALQDINANKQVIADCGYELVEHFKLPSECWFKNYYDYLTPHILKLKERYRDNQEAMELIEQCQLEEQLFRKYNEFYGYMFYIMRKIQ